MVSRDFQALAARRADRARKLAARYPASAEPLLFFAEISSLQREISASLKATPAGLDEALDALAGGRRPLVELVEARGPQRLGDEARRYDETACRESLRAYIPRDDITSPRSFFARVLLQPAMFTWDARTFEPPAFTQAAPAAVDRASRCPRCGHSPQVGCLRPQGDGAALALVCSLCLHEWPFARPRCPGCGENDHHKIAFCSSSEFAHLDVQVCESCKAYLHMVHLEKEAEAVPDVDELAALPLDVWAQEKGYLKIQPNLAGI
ncbi:MAG: formate dehydrogenase accessory protein FdhE [Bryobacterales bacterium]